MIFSSFEHVGSYSFGFWIITAAVYVLSSCRFGLASLGILGSLKFAAGSVFFSVPFFFLSFLIWDYLVLNLS